MVKAVLVTLSVLFITYMPVRDYKSDRLGVVLSDIESHMPAIHIYKDRDLVTWGHETTHGINSNLRSKFGGTGKVNGCYILNNYAIILHEPNIKLSSVARFTRHRGGTYDLYLVQQLQYWNDEPLYMLDEWTCYVNGSLVGLEKNLNRSESLLFAIEFCFHAEALLKSVEHNDYTYSDKDKLKRFIDWQTKRVFAMVYVSKGTNMASPTHDILLQKLKDPQAFIGSKETVLFKRPSKCLAKVAY